MASSSGTESMDSAINRGTVAEIDYSDAIACGRWRDELRRLLLIIVRSHAKCESSPAPK